MAPAFTVYQDRIEILSKGLLPPKQTMDGFFAGESVPVNEKLARIILQLHISEQTGRGVPAIVDAYGKVAEQIAGPESAGMYQSMYQSVKEMY